MAIHILTQGLVRWIREWYLRREKKDLQSQTQQDPEAGKSATFSPRSGRGWSLFPADKRPNSGPYLVCGFYQEAKETERTGSDPSAFVGGAGEHEDSNGEGI